MLTALTQLALLQVVVDSDPEAVDNPMSFTISLTVADNPYLFAQTVTKTFNHSPELELFRISTSGVKWKPGHVRPITASAASRVTGSSD